MPIHFSPIAKVLPFVVALAAAPVFGQGSDRCDAVQRSSRAQAQGTLHSFETSVRLNGFPERSTQDLIDIANRTRNSEVLATAVQILLQRGIRGTKVVRPYRTDEVISSQDDQITHYKVWLSDPANVLFTPEAETIFGELAPILNGVTKWELLHSSADFDKLLPLLVSIPHQDLFRVLVAEADRAANPKATLVETSARNLLYMAITLFMGGISGSPVLEEPLASAMLRSTRGGRLFRVTPENPGVYRSLMEGGSGGSRFPWKFDEEIFALDRLPEGANPGATFSFKNTKILLAEDKSELAQPFIQRLREWGVKEVHWAENGAQAVELTKANQYDVIFMDMEMPVMDGQRATELIRNSDKTTPIVLNSSEDIMPELGNRWGFNAQVIKDSELGVPLDDLPGLMNYWVDQGLIVPK